MADLETTRDSELSQARFVADQIEALEVAFAFLERGSIFGPFFPTVFEQELGTWCSGVSGLFVPTITTGGDSGMLMVTELCVNGGTPGAALKETIQCADHLFDGAIALDMQSI